MQTTKFEISDYLDDPKVIASYLNTVLEEGDSDELIVALGHITKAIGMTKIAQKTGMSRPSLYKALSEGAKPQFETHGDELLGLLQAAVKRMGDTAFDRRLAQTLQQQISTSAHMQDDRQVVLLGQIELCLVKKLLPRHVQAGHKSVQTDFTYRYQAGVFSVLLQSKG